MRELEIQAEVGRRLREIIGRTGPLRANTATDERVEIIEALIEDEGSPFTAEDKNALYALSLDAVRALGEQFLSADSEDDVPEIDTFAQQAHRRRGRAQERVHGVADEIAAGMVPLTVNEVLKRKKRQQKAVTHDDPAVAAMLAGLRR